MSRVWIPRTKWAMTFADEPPWVECPYCTRMMLGPEARHGIRSNGEVVERVVCANQRCGFTAFITLENWPEQEIASR